jgi:hypothetical protein
MTDWPYWAKIENAQITLEPGAWQGEIDVRNDGPALWFDDGSGGVIVEAKDKEELVATLKTILDRVEEMPDPVPDAACKHCGRAIRWVPEGDDAMIWLHKPTIHIRADGGRFIGSSAWDQVCTDEHGEEMGTPSNPAVPVTAWPAITDATPRVGDQVLDIGMVDDDDLEDVADVGIVTSTRGRRFILDWDGVTHRAEELRVVALYEEQAS